LDVTFVVKAESFFDNHHNLAAFDKKLKIKENSQIRSVFGGDLSVLGSRRIRLLGPIARAGRIRRCVAQRRRMDPPANEKQRDQCAVVAVGDNCLAVTQFAG
jgi:hypothetical protein